MRWTGSILSASEKRNTTESITTVGRGEIIMSRGFNRVILMGNLAKDPDIRATQSKQKVARLTVAVGKQWKDKQTGETKSHTDFINVSAWGFTADICEKYLSKGKPVLIEGRISVRDYDEEIEKMIRGAA